MSLFVQQVILGLMLGGVYVAVAIGFSLVWGVLNIVNLAHGALVVVGMYATWFLFTHAGIDPFLTLPLDAVVLFAIGYLVQRGLINRVIRAPLFFTLLLTFAVGAACAGVAGGLLSTVQAISPTAGEPYTLQAFVVVILGGLGRVSATVVGGLLFGLIEVLAQSQVPGLGAGWSNAIAFAV